MGAFFSSLVVSRSRPFIPAHSRADVSAAYSGRHSNCDRRSGILANLPQTLTSAPNPWNRVILRVHGVDALYRDLVERGLAPTSPRNAEWGERYFELSDPQGLVISFAELL